MYDAVHTYSVKTIRARIHFGKTIPIDFRFRNGETSDRMFFKRCTKKMKKKKL